MSKRKIAIICLALVSMFISVISVFAQQVPDAPSAVAKTLKGMNIVIGNYWDDYDPAKTPPNSQWTGSESQEKQLDFRKRLLQKYNFKMSDKMVASWGEMSQIAATSIMAGRPAASVFVVQPDWALALYRQGLLFPVGSQAPDNKFWTAKWGPANNLGEWNESVKQAFTFKSGKSDQAYAFATGYGGSNHAACVFWNKRLFKEAGIDPDEPYNMQKNGTWTWNNFLALCKKLTRDINNDGRIDIYAMPGDLSTEILDAFVSSNKAMYVDKDPKTNKLVLAITRPEFIEAVQFYMRLRDEGVMKPKPAGDDTPWNWHIPEFNDGRVAMRIDQQYLVTQDLRNFKDDWGMVLPPKGPRAKDYVVFNDENVMIIPAKTPPDQVKAILWAVQQWGYPTDDNWKVAQYPLYRDRRAVDETLTMIRDRTKWQWRYHMHVPGLNRGGIAWEIWWHDGEPAKLIESVRLNWTALIEDANSEM